MNGYIYEVENDWVIERYGMYGKDRPIVNMWSFSQLKKDNDSVSKLDRESFARTKKWLENHSELMI